MYDDYGYEMEAIEQERWDADLEMAEMSRVGRAIDRARAAGVCCHQGVVGYVAGKVFYPEQVGLEPGQSRCTDGCGRVFTSDDDWQAAMSAAIGY